MGTYATRIDPKETEKGLLAKWETEEQ